MRNKWFGEVGYDKAGETRGGIMNALHTKLKCWNHYPENKGV